MRISAGLIVLAAIATPAPALAAHLKVKDAAGLAEASRRAKPGDSIILANGNWKNQQLVFSARGAPGKPILLIAETKGKVILTA